MTLREASGVPVETHVGTNYRNMRDALLEIFGPSKGGLIIGKVTDEELLSDLPVWGRVNLARDVYSIVLTMERLPRYLRRHVGYTWKGRHAVSLGGVRVCNGDNGGRHTGHSGVKEVYLMDPMGRTTRDYYGEWAPYSEIKGALARTRDGMVASIHAQRRAAHSSL